MNHSERTDTVGYSPAPRIWLVGSFFQKGVTGRTQALYEVAYTFAVSAMPFWVGGIILLAQGKGDLSDGWLLAYLRLLVSTFEKGELLIFAVSFVSPALWLASHEPDGAKTLPHKRPIVMITVLIGIVGAALYSLTLAQTNVKMEVIFAVSSILAVLAVVTMYLALTYHGFRLPVNLNEEDLRRPQNDFLSKYNQHRSRP